MTTKNIYLYVVEKSNLNLANKEELKRIIKAELLESDLLSSTLKASMYIENEINSFLLYIYGKSKIFDEMKLAYKIHFLLNMELIDRHLFDALNVLNDLRNKLAHEIEYSQNNNCYKKIKDSLSSYLKKSHDIEVEMRTLISGDLEEEKKYKLLLLQIWINTVIYFSGKERIKYEYAKRLISEVEIDLGL